MTEIINKLILQPIPTKRYFTIGEVADLCGVKPHVLRYWEQEFGQLKPVKRRGNRRYYQYHEVILVRRIRELLYEQGFTISGARGQLEQAVILQSPASREQPSLFENEGKNSASDWRCELRAIIELLSI
ncbi:MAG: MerR family transcriptional regulator [Proteobacteria bacterium]|nr:MerR family transcriptional regulator [Pseudomonadota bacterium]MDE3207803.1 MerR family transcriptional regulator [Pseudomonadota bacterium]